MLRTIDSKTAKLYILAGVSTHTNHKDSGYNQSQRFKSLCYTCARYLSSGPIINQSFYYNFRNQNIYLTAKIEPLDDKHFVYFVDCLSKVFKLDTTSRSPNLPILLFIYYKTLHISLSSEFYQYLVVSEKYYSFPMFMHALILKIGQRVRSVNSPSSFTEGWVKSSNTVSDCIKRTIHLIESDVFRQIIAECTQFSYQTRYWNNQKQDSLNFIRNICSYDGGADKDFYSTLARIISDLSMIFHSGSCKFVLNNYTYTQSGFTSLGLFRFRRTLQTRTFYLSLASIKEVSQDSFDLFCCILNIFNPLFLADDGSILPAVRLAGDGVCDVSLLERKIAFEFIFRLETGSVPGSVHPLVGSKSGASNKLLSIGSGVTTNSRRGFSTLSSTSQVRKTPSNYGSTFRVYVNRENFCYGLPFMSSCQQPAQNGVP
jgi:hypothetical protein